MIRYEDINQEDLARYWGEGCVFLQQGESWNAYTIISIRDEQIHLGLCKQYGVFGDPLVKISMTYPQFFEQAMLHRPSLGVLIRKTGEVVALGWQHANGNELAKAIRRQDVFVLGLDTRPVEKPKPVDELWEDVFLHHLRLLRERVAQPPPNWVLANGFWDELREILIEYENHPACARAAMLDGPMARGANPEAIRLVLEFMNQKTRTLTEALREFDGKPLFVCTTIWLRADGSNIAFMNGKHFLGHINPATAQLRPVSAPRAASLAATHLYQSLLGGNYV